VVILVEVTTVDTVVVDLVDVVDVVVDFVPQDASTIDVTMRKVITIQRIPLFIHAPLFILKTFGLFDDALIFLYS
jgi:hypothetical protein